MDHPQVTLHGTCVVVGGRGVLILGPPGSGKSSLALRLMDEPGQGLSKDLMAAELVSDDQVIVTRAGRSLVASAPAQIKGKFEIRGLAIVEVPTLPKASLSLAVKLRPSSEIERLPDPASFDILGLSLPMVEIDAQAASAPSRLRAALNWLG
jgi:HPr kinase/phosphorylase